MADLSQISLLGLDRSELASLVDGLPEPPYRAKQLLEAVYRQRVESVEQISTLPQQLRLKLTEKGVSVGLPRIEKRFVSQDGTVRYLIALADGQSVETVWMPEGDGGEAGDGSEAGEGADDSSLGTSHAKARSEQDEPIADLERSAQKPSAAHSPGGKDLQGQKPGRSTI